MLYELHTCFQDVKKSEFCNGEVKGVLLSLASLVKNWALCADHNNDKTECVS